MPINKHTIILITLGLFCINIVLSVIEEKKYVKRFLRLDLLYQEKKAYQGLIKVKISGCITKPGTYILSYGKRLSELIIKAGGLSIYAGKINRSILLKDGNEYFIPYRKIKTGEAVNINFAPFEILCMLPMINESVAHEIINYRNKYEKFEDIEELKEIYGIGEKKFELLKKFVIIGE
ncbi:MAG: helix-hairpin-helix domain-containing protein [Spirochaetes bacterium]|nr:helix-hairpin-helix domain-containing protein [Spirochaetota bacterium]